MVTKDDLLNSKRIDPYKNVGRVFYDLLNAPCENVDEEIKTNQWFSAEYYAACYIVDCLKQEDWYQEDWHEDEDLYEDRKKEPWGGWDEHLNFLFDRLENYRSDACYYAFENEDEFEDLRDLERDKVKSLVINHFEAERHGLLVEEMKEKAEEGDSNTQNKLGEMYRCGRGVFPSYQEEELRSKAGAGDAEAQFNLGEIYYYGIGVPCHNAIEESRSKQEAAKWYLKAAEQGHAGAQFNLGVMYHYGIDVIQDFKEAFKWYLKAAKQGHEKAQLYLGAMYRDGQGVPKNDQEAAKWFDKSGYKDARK